MPNWQADFRSKGHVTPYPSLIITGHGLSSTDISSSRVQCRLPDSGLGLLAVSSYEAFRGETAGSRRVLKPRSKTIHPRQQIKDLSKNNKPYSLPPRQSHFRLCF